jgi:hypothetical protein
MGDIIMTLGESNRLSPPVLGALCRGAGAGALRQLPPAKRFVARRSGPSARQAERSEKRGCGRQPLPAKRFVARRSEPSARQSPHLRRKNPEGGLYSRKHPRVRECKAPGRAPAGGVEGIALGTAGFWGQRPQLLSNVGAHTNYSSQVKLILSPKQRA